MVKSFRALRLQFACCRSVRSLAVVVAGTILLAATSEAARGQATTSVTIVPQDDNDGLRQPNYFAVEAPRKAIKSTKTNQRTLTSAQPPASAQEAITAALNAPNQHPLVGQQVHFQQELEDAAAAAREEAEFDASIAKNPCAAMPIKSLGELGINITMPEGEFPVDEAGACWNTINESTGPYAGARLWGVSTFAWNATCLCHRPLYFEQVNLERYGYGCCECMQPAASAAHFFCTIPALPYCIAADCPGDCDYTLGHYRPGSCPPWRVEWPPCSPRGALAEGGVWTGLIFLIP